MPRARAPAGARSQLCPTSGSDLFVSSAAVSSLLRRPLPSRSTRDGSDRPRRGNGPRTRSSRTSPASWSSCSACSACCHHRATARDAHGRTSGSSPRRASRRGRAPRGLPDLWRVDEEFRLPDLPTKLRRVARRARSSSARVDHLPLLRGTTTTATGRSRRLNAAAGREIARPDRRAGAGVSPASARSHHGQLNSQGAADVPDVPIRDWPSRPDRAAAPRQPPALRRGSSRSLSGAARVLARRSRSRRTRSLPSAARPDSPCGRSGAPAGRPRSGGSRSAHRVEPGRRLATVADGALCDSAAAAAALEHLAQRGARRSRSRSSPASGDSWP